MFCFILKLPASPQQNQPPSVVGAMPSTITTSQNSAGEFHMLTPRNITVGHESIQVDYSIFFSQNL